MDVPDNIAEAIRQSNQALADTLAGAFQNLRYQRASTIKLSKFTGHPRRAGDQTLNEWMADLETYSRQLGLSLNEQVNTALDHLGGTAKEEVLCSPLSERETLSSLLALLRRRFGAPETVQSLMSALYSRSQLHGESLADFSRALIRLFDRMESAAGDRSNREALAKLRETTLKEQFVKGVIDTSLRRELRKLIFDHESLSFFELRELALGLFPDTENSGSSDDSVDMVRAQPVMQAYHSVDAARSSKPNAPTCDDAKFAELIESQKQLVTSIQLMVDGQKEMRSEMQRMSGAIEGLKEQIAKSYSRPQTKCSFCHKPGHRVENCFKRQRLAQRTAETTQSSAGSPQVAGNE